MFMPGFFFSICNYFDCKHTYKKLNYNENFKKKKFLNSLILVLHFILHHVCLFQTAQTEDSFSAYYQL